MFKDHSQSYFIRTILDSAMQYSVFNALVDFLFISKSVQIVLLVCSGDVKITA